MKIGQAPSSKMKTTKMGRYKSVKALRKAKLQQAVKETKNVNWEQVLSK